MKKTIIVYDSYFGNTKKIAEAIETVVKGELDTSIIPINDFSITMLDDVQIFITGSPTRGFRPSEAFLNLFKKLPVNALQGKQVVTFDTRIDPIDIHSAIFRFIVKSGGYAGPKIGKELAAKGGKMVLPAEGFFVEKSEGPLKNGEEARASEWGKKIISLLKTT